jgi:hypothetical protein
MYLEEKKQKKIVDVFEKTEESHRCIWKNRRRS